MISIPLCPCLCLPLSWWHCICIPQQIAEQLWSARGFKTVSNSVFLILFSFPLGKWSTSMFISAIILVSNINKWRTVLRLVRWGSSHPPRCARVVFGADAVLSNALLGCCAWSGQRHCPASSVAARRQFWWPSWCTSCWPLVYWSTPVISISESTKDFSDGNFWYVCLL